MTDVIFLVMSVPNPYLQPLKSSVASRNESKSKTPERKSRPARTVRCRMARCRARFFNDEEETKHADEEHLCQQCQHYQPNLQGHQARAHAHMIRPVLQKKPPPMEWITIKCDQHRFSHMSWRTIRQCQSGCRRFPLSKAEENKESLVSKNEPVKSTSV